MSGADLAIPSPLAAARERIAPVLRAASARLEPTVRRIVDYHWGFVDEHGQPVDARPGKALRPALVLLSAEATGQDSGQALPAAAAVEIVHDFTLLHDDVMDEDRMRRGRPAAWTLFGVGGAICAGDALMLLAAELLLEDPGAHRRAAQLALTEATQAVIAGQTLDLCFEGRTDIEVADYLDMAAKKTGALLGVSASLGAILYGAGSDVCKALRRFGEGLGLAFQAADDWLGIWGDPERTGKPAASDLRQRKASLPIVLAMGSPEPAGAVVREWMRGKDAVEKDAVEERGLERVLDVLDAFEIERSTRERARLELDGALDALGSASIVPEVRTRLAELAHFVVERGF